MRLQEKHHIMIFRLTESRKIISLYNENMIVNKYLYNFRDFVKNLDIGIKVQALYSNLKDTTYVITDEKKWMLAKIKYGF